MSIKVPRVLEGFSDSGQEIEMISEANGNDRVFRLSKGGSGPVWRQIKYLKIYDFKKIDGVLAPYLIWEIAIVAGSKVTIKIGQKVPGQAQSFDISFFIPMPISPAAKTCYSAAEVFMTLRQKQPAPNGTIEPVLFIGEFRLTAFEDTPGATYHRYAKKFFPLSIPFADIPGKIRDVFTPNLTADAAQNLGFEPAPVIRALGLADGMRVANNNFASASFSFRFDRVAKVAKKFSSVFEQNLQVTVGRPVLNPLGLQPELNSFPLATGNYRYITIRSFPPAVQPIYDPSFGARFEMEIDFPFDRSFGEFWEKKVIYPVVSSQTNVNAGRRATFLPSFKVKKANEFEFLTCRFVVFDKSIMTVDELKPPIKLSEIEVYGVNSSPDAPVKVYLVDIRPGKVREGLMSVAASLNGVKTFDREYTPSRQPIEMKARLIPTAQDAIKESLVAQLKDTED